MWQSRTKNDLIIEVWEKLDCENVGEAEIMAIEEVLAGEYGKQAVESPMKIARLLADEGAELRYPEIMRLWVERSSEIPYGAEFLNLSKFSNFAEALSSLRNFDNLRRKFANEDDKEGIRLMREEAISAKSELLKQKDKGLQAAEIAEWITIWLQSPEIFDQWIEFTFVTYCGSAPATKFPFLTARAGNSCAGSA